MAGDINSPRVRQILAIHAEQAAEAKAELLELQVLADQLRTQRDGLYDLVTAAAEDYRCKAPVMGALKNEFNACAWELHRLARGLTDDPGPCPSSHLWSPGHTSCPVCGTTIDVTIEPY